MRTYGRRAVAVAIAVLIVLAAAAAYRRHAGNAAHLNVDTETAADSTAAAAGAPPIPYSTYGPRPRDSVIAAYRFAAAHPEIVEYLPCFCGCNRIGHRGNGDCFVRKRAADGAVTHWDEHGLHCALCIEVSNRAERMYRTGRTVHEIRSAIDHDLGRLYPMTTDTPYPTASPTP
jgi:hypothetical protein